MSERSRQEFDVFVDDHFQSRISAFSNKQAVAWFLKTRGYQDSTVIKERTDAKPAQPVEIAKGCPECGHIGAKEHGSCDNCGSPLCESTLCGSAI